MMRARTLVLLIACACALVFAVACGRYGPPVRSVASQSPPADSPARQNPAPYRAPEGSRDEAVSYVREGITPDSAREADNEAEQEQDSKTDQKEAAP